MMIIEGGSFNTQATISYGFSYASTWDYAFTRLSGRANFGNGTGSILVDSLQDGAITWQNVTDDKKVVQFVYRGIENPYGQVWEFEDGIQKYGVKADGGYWWTADTDLYTSENQQTSASPVYQRVAHYWTDSIGWPKTWDIKTFLPITSGGSSITYMCDYLYIDSATGTSIVHRGGVASTGSNNGIGFMGVSNGLQLAHRHVGGRIAC